MIQKTYHIERYSYQKLTDILAEVASMPAYRDSAQVLLVIMEQNWDRDCIKEKTDAIRSLLSKAEIAGVTHFDGPTDGAEIPNNTILSFFFFESPAFSVFHIGLAGRGENEIGEELRDLIKTVSAPRCLMTFFADRNRDIAEILNTAGPQFPVLGATAGIDTFFINGEGEGLVFDQNAVFENTLLAVLFHGEQLHVKVSYNFGWTQVGKTMTITKLKDPYTVAEIDHRPAAEVYGKYLGIPWRTNSLSVLNICEFPIVVERDELRLGRIPYAWTEEGDLKLAITMHEGEKLRLSYGLPQQIFTGICDDAESFRTFCPQAMLMVVCMNRMLFLGDQERLETDAYRRILPEAAWLHGNSEVYRANGVGGEMHSALLAVGFREGDKVSPVPEAACSAAPSGDAVIPLELRLMTFLRAVTGDLQETTDELIDLKNHLEDEVERKTQEKESLELHVVQTLAEAIDAKDSYTNGHSGRVAAYSREIARRAGYSVKAQNEIFMMGLLHDVGKIGVPDAVINKPGRLTDEEFAKIKNHPVMGARILKTIREMPKLVTGARWHHERYDGRGYPDGLKGTDIPEEARIIGVADAYDAMTSNRSYRESMPQSRVREQIEGGRGTQFDPRFADIMLQMIDEDTEYRMRES